MDKATDHRFTSGEEYVQCGCVKSKGFCHYKCTNGREFWGRYSVPKSLIIKRHLAVDTRSLAVFYSLQGVQVCLMTVAGIELLSNHLDYFRAKPVNIPKITILLDNGYHPDKITTEKAKNLSPDDDQDPV